MSLIENVQKALSYNSPKYFNETETFKNNKISHKRYRISREEM